MTEAEQHLIDVAILLAQELQEYVDVAIECAGSNSAELEAENTLLLAETLQQQIIIDGFINKLEK